MYDNQNLYDISFSSKSKSKDIIENNFICSNDVDPLTKENIKSMSPRERLKIENTCFSVMSLYEYIQKQDDRMRIINPKTQKFFTISQIKHVYDAMNIINKERNINWDPTILFENNFIINENQYRWIVNFGGQNSFTIPKNFDVNNKTSENILTNLYKLKQSKKRYFSIYNTKQKSQDIYYLNHFEIVITKYLNSSQKNSIILRRNDWDDQNILYNITNERKQAFNIDRIISLHDYLEQLVKKQ